MNIKYFYALLSQFIKIIAPYYFLQVTISQRLDPKEIWKASGGRFSTDSCLFWWK